MTGKQPLSLDGLIQSKGTSRPDTMQQRGAAVSPTQQPVQTPPAAPPTRTSEPKSKALTLRLSETQYQRLRRFAFDRGLSHQDVIERALLDHLDASAD